MSDFPEKPPCRLPNGKSNPEYQRWWRSTEKGKQRTKDHKESDKRKEFQREYNHQNKRKIIDFNLLRNDKSRSTATMAGMRWGVVEDSYLLDNAGKMTDKEIAKSLGRSIRSCTTRLWSIRKDERQGQ